jgi:Ca2+-transporting ATPase
MRFLKRIDVPESHAASALSAQGSVPWDAELTERASDHMVRMERAGRRVMASAVRDLDPADFDGESDLLRYVMDLEVTSLVGMVDPPRAESRDAVANGQAADIRVRMVTGDDVTTGAAITEQLGVPARPFSAPTSRRYWSTCGSRASTRSASSAVSLPTTR